MDQGAELITLQAQSGTRVYVTVAPFVYNTTMNSISQKLVKRSATRGKESQSTWATLPVHNLPFPLAEIVIFVGIKGRGSFFSSLLYSVLTRLDNRGFFLFGLVQVFDTPQGSLGLVVFDLAHIDTALVQDVAKLVKMLQR